MPDHTVREHALATTLISLAAIVSLSLEALDRTDPGTRSPRDHMTWLLRGATEQWSKEHPDVPPAVHVMVRRFVYESVIRDD